MKNVEMTTELQLSYSLRYSTTSYATTYVSYLLCTLSSYKMDYNDA